MSVSLPPPPPENPSTPQIPQVVITAAPRRAAPSKAGRLKSVSGNVAEPSARPSNSSNAVHIKTKGIELLTASWPDIVTKPVNDTELFVAPKSYYGNSSLVYNTLKPATHAAYTQALHRLRDFVAEKCVTFQQLDAELTKLASNLHAVNGGSTKAPSGRQLLTNAIAALVHRVPALKHHLNLSRKSLRRWTLNAKPTQAWPLTRDLLQAFAGDLVA